MDSTNQPNDIEMKTDNRSSDTVETSINESIIFPSNIEIKTEIKELDYVTDVLHNSNESTDMEMKTEPQTDETLNRSTYQKLEESTEPTTAEGKVKQILPEGTEYSLDEVDAEIADITNSMIDEILKETGNTPLALKLDPEETAALLAFPLTELKASPPSQKDEVLREENESIDKQALQSSAGSSTSIDMRRTPSPSDYPIMVYGERVESPLEEEPFQWNHISEYADQTELNSLEAIHPYSTPFPKLYRARNIVRRNENETNEIKLITFLNKRVVVAMTGLYRAYHTITLQFEAKDYRLNHNQDIKDLHLGLYEGHNVIILDKNIIDHNFVTEMTVNPVPYERNFLKLFKTSIGNILISTNGWIYELYLNLEIEPYTIRLAPITQITNGIECVALVESQTKNECYGGVLLAVGYQQLLGYYHIKQIKEPKIDGSGREFKVTFLFNARTSYVSPMAMVASKDALYLTRLGPQQLENGERIHLMEIKWINIVNGQAVWRDRYLPGNNIVFLDQEAGYLVIGLSDSMILIYRTRDMRKAFVVQTTSPAILGKYLVPNPDETGYLLTVSNENAIECRKLPTKTQICPECLTIFEKDMIVYKTTPSYTTFACRHWSPKHQ